MFLHNGNKKICDVTTTMSLWRHNLYFSGHIGLNFRCPELPDPLTDFVEIWYLDIWKYFGLLSSSINSDFILKNLKFRYQETNGTIASELKSLVPPDKLVAVVTPDNLRNQE